MSDMTPFILEGITLGIGLALGVLIIATTLTMIVIAAQRLRHTRPAWWIRTRLALHRARPTIDGR